MFTMAVEVSRLVFRESIDGFECDFNSFRESCHRLTKVNIISIVALRASAIHLKTVNFLNPCLSDTLWNRPPLPNQWREMRSIFIVETWLGLES